VPNFKYLAGLLKESTLSQYDLGVLKKITRDALGILHTFLNEMTVLFPVDCKKTLATPLVFLSV
jgi:hypothetical protein